MSGLTNQYLEKTAFKLIGKQLFSGVYPADGCTIVPRKKTFCVIFNTGRANSPGYHFVSIYVTPLKVYYFDSFGKNKIQNDISKFIVKLNRKCFMHCRSIQDKSSNFCGYFALAFLLWMKKNKKSSRFYSMFDVKKLTRNNEIVTKFILDEIQ